METQIGAAVQAAAGRANATRPLTAEQLAEMDNEAELRRRHAAADSLVKQAGGKRYTEHRFANWISRSDYQRQVALLAEEYADTIGDRLLAMEGLVLYGPVGTGKDHLMMAAMRKAIIQSGVRIAWQNCQDFFGEVRDRISSELSEASLIRRLESPQVLVLSDLLPPTGGLSQHQATMLYRVVENRYAAGRVTCATINVAGDEEADAQLGEPTWDRLCDRAWKVFFNWGTHRKPSRELKP